MAFTDQVSNKPEEIKTLCAINGQNRLQIEYDHSYNTEDFCNARQVCYDVIVWYHSKLSFKSTSAPFMPGKAQLPTGLMLTATTPHMDPRFTV
jgi:hypothetical protein